MSVRARCWCFTLNNYEEKDEENLGDLIVSGKADYVVWGREVGDNGTPHLQGYIEFKEGQKMQRVKTILQNDRYHLEQRRGSQKQAVDYCKKDGDFEEFGVPKKASSGGDPDAKNKALRYLELIKEGRLAEIASDPDCTFNILKHVKEMAPLVEAPRDRNLPMEVTWFYGPTGTGKTRRAYWEAEKMGKPVYVKSSNSKWFDGYDGEEYVIFDDLRSSWFPYDMLLHLLDRYPYRVECKGGSRQWKALHIWVSSPYHPKEMYSTMQERDLDKDKIDQLLRRVTRVVHMSGETPFGKQSWVEPIEES